MSIGMVLRAGLAIGLLALLAACSGSDDEAGAGEQARDIAGPQGFRLWAEPRPLPELNFVDASGDALTLADFEGRVVLLNIWATWCPPCREEMPMLDRVQAELGGPEFEVLTLSIDQSGDDVVDEFYQETGLEHLNIYIDRTGKAAVELNALGVPTTLLLDRQGREIGRLVGATEWHSPAMLDFFRQTIERTR